MAKASILRKLNDEDLNKIHHAIRRDAMSDLEIARLAEHLLSENPKSKIQNPKSDAASAMVIARYRNSKVYKAWLNRWENQDVELKRAIETQKQRFEFLSNLVKTAQGDGLKAVSQSLMARLLTLASELTDEELKSAAAGKQGWVVKIINAVTDDLKREQATTPGKTGNIPEGKPVDDKAVLEKVDEIMGLKK
jgi:hypothetical protein